jgi:hypothetical protein
MDVTINMADVVSDVQFRLHIPTIGSTSFVTSAQMLQLLQRSVGRLGALLTRSFSDGYWARTADLTTQAGVDVVSLPPGFTTLTSLHWINGNDAVLLLRAHDVDYTPRAQSWTGSPLLPWGWNGARVSGYVLEGSAIRLIPPPSDVYTLRCAYQAGLSITSLADNISAEDISWADWLALDCCIVIRSRESKDASDFIMLKQEIETNLRDQAQQRDRNAVYQVRDARNELDNTNPFFYRRGF